MGCASLRCHSALVKTRRLQEVGNSNFQISSEKLRKRESKFGRGSNKGTDGRSGAIRFCPWADATSQRAVTDRARNADVKWQWVTSVLTRSICDSDWQTDCTNNALVHLLRHFRRRIRAKRYFRNKGTLAVPKVIFYISYVFHLYYSTNINAIKSRKPQSRKTLTSTTFIYWPQLRLTLRMTLTCVT